MHGHRSFLVIGDNNNVDIMNLQRNGFEISDCNFSFRQGIDRSGKATTRVHGGIINITISQLPTNAILDWGIQSRKYLDGAIIVLDNENIPVEKTLFNHAACVALQISYTDRGKGYAMTNMVLNAEQLIVGSGIEFNNEWTIK